MRCLTLMIVALSVAAVAHAQGSDEKSKYKSRYDSQADNKKFDPHDLSGIWQLTKNDHSLGTPAPALGSRSLIWRRYKITATAPPARNAGPKIAYGTIAASSENAPPKAAPGRACAHCTPGERCSDNRTEGMLGTSGALSVGVIPAGPGAGDTTASIPGTRIWGAPHCLQNGVPSSTAAPHL